MERVLNNPSAQFLDSALTEMIAITLTKLDPSMIERSHLDMSRASEVYYCYILQERDR